MLQSLQSGRWRWTQETVTDSSNLRPTTSVFNNFVDKSPVHGAHNYYFTNVDLTTLTSLNFTAC